jgi:hypothetical protein
MATVVSKDAITINLPSCSREATAMVPIAKPGRMSELPNGYFGPNLNPGGFKLRPSKMRDGLPMRNVVMVISAATSCNIQSGTTLTPRLATTN